MIFQATCITRAGAAWAANAARFRIRAGWGSESDSQSQHYAFLVPDDRFDAVIARLDAVGVTYFADPGHTDPGRVNHMFGGRGAYFDDPDGHNMEIITRPYARP